MTWRDIDYRRIDVHRWQRDGFLTGKQFFDWQWSNDAGEQVASIQVAVGMAAPDRVTMNYRRRD